MNWRWVWKWQEGRNRLKGSCFLEDPFPYLGFPGGLDGKESKAGALPAVCKIWVQSLGRENPLEKEMTSHSSILARKTPWTEEPGGLQSMGSQSCTWLIYLHFLFFPPLSTVNARGLRGRGSQYGLVSLRVLSQWSGSEGRVWYWLLQWQKRFSFSKWKTG